MNKERTAWSLPGIATFVVLLAAAVLLFGFMIWYISQVLVAAGEAAGILESLLDRLAIYQEKTLELKRKIKSALMYPIAVVVVAFVVLTVIMIFVIPAFKDVFRSFGADLPATSIWLLLMTATPAES